MSNAKPDDFKSLLEIRFDSLTKLFEEKITGVTNQASFHVKMWMWVTGFMFAGIVGILGSGWGIFWSLSKDIASVSADVGAVKAQLTFVRLGTDKLEKLDFEQLSSNIAGLTRRIDQVDRAPVQSPPIEFDPKEKQLLRQFVAKASQPGSKPLAQIGEIVPDSVSLLPFPVNLRDQIPKLRNTRYVLDNGGVILIVANRDNRVVAVVF